MLFKQITGAALALLMAVISFADAPDASSELIAHLEGIEQFSAQFSQTMSGPDGELIQQASGLAYARRPAKLRWQIESPDQQLIIADGVKIWRYEADLAQVTVDAYTPELSAAPALLLSGDVDTIIQHYYVTGGDGSFLLTPLNDSDLFVSLQVTFQGDMMESIVLNDGFEQTTVINFSAVDISSILSDDLFRFEAPAGVDVLHND
ncbi:MAG: outer membrane lipoprotein chaperone LolA [Pseudomonadales bacterium]